MQGPGKVLQLLKAGGGLYERRVLVRAAMEERVWGSRRAGRVTVRHRRRVNGACDRAFAASAATGSCSVATGIHGSRCNKQ